ncbi:MAG: CinA family nicotinamide mononucleotide deamidase-related protein [Ardenticatenales bacterium]|nr:CinA family nicotinamide mononucleotide deamidase-related protein [Ardenticatenales bacterium]
MRAEIISIGTELLLGQIVDTNAAWIAQRLAAEGVNLYRKQTIGDNQQRAADAIREALARADLVLTTGGLGPTVDDVTREAIADATGRELVRDAALAERVERIFARWSRPAGENNLRQADLPAGARSIPNPVGTAPGILLKTDEGKVIIAMPGVPHEMKQMMTEQVIPYLREQGLAAIIKIKVLRSAAIGESLIDDKIADLEKLENPTVGLSAHLGQVDIRVTARAATEKEADVLIEHVAGQIRRRLGEGLFGEDDITLEAVISDLLDHRDEAVALYETLTNGEIASTLRAIGAPVAGQEVGEVGELPDEETAKVRASLFAAEHCAAWCVAVYSTEGEHDYEESQGESLIVVAGPQHARVTRYPLVGKGEIARTWLKVRALDLLRRELLKAKNQ